MMFIDFDSTAAQCAPSVAPATLRAIAYVESGFNPYAIGVVGNRLQRQPKNLPEAMSTAHALKEAKVRFSAGMIQIYVGNWPAYNLNTETAFDPCANMRAAAGILGNCYARAKSKQPDSQVALKQALSCYYSNNFVTGFQHGYVQKVVAAAQRFGAQAPKPTLVAAATSI
jgi:type IV secretion system protein VirB1